MWTTQKGVNLEDFSYTINTGKLPWGLGRGMEDTREGGDKGEEENQAKTNRLAADLKLGSLCPHTFFSAVLAASWPSLATA
jgi:hypothetical protein